MARTSISINNAWSSPICMPAAGPVFSCVTRCSSSWCASGGVECAAAYSSMAASTNWVRLRAAGGFISVLLSTAAWMLPAPELSVARYSASVQRQWLPGPLYQRGPDEPVPGDQGGELTGGEPAGPGRPRWQHHVAGLRRGVPDRDLDLNGQRQAELVEHGPRLP